MQLSHARKILIFGLAILFAPIVKSQDSLPNFTLINKGNGRIIVSWKNPYTNITQISIQRSYDSLKRFSTIFSSPSPQLPQNGFTDKIIPSVKTFYKIFYVLSTGQYFFSKSQSPPKQISIDSTTSNVKRDNSTELIKNILTPTKILFIKKDENIVGTIKYKDYAKYKDSVIKNTKSELFFIPPDTIVVKESMEDMLNWKMSIYVYTDKNGYIVVNLPNALTKKYNLKILDEDDSLILELDHINQTYLILDKTNFYHAGWYKFELIEDGAIKEKGKLYLPKDDTL